MISGNKISTAQNKIPGIKSLFADDFKHLPAYAKYLLTSKLDEYITYQVNKARQMQLSFVEQHVHFMQEELFTACITKTEELLEQAAENKTAAYIRNVLPGWFSKQLLQPGTKKIMAEDITFIIHLQREALCKFIPDYINNVHEFSTLLNEINLFTTQVETVLLTTALAFKKQQQKEKQLNETNRFAEKITNISPCIITVYNVDTGNYKFVNNAVQSILGYAPGKFMEKGRAFFYKIMHPQDKLSIQQTIAGFIERTNTTGNKKDEVHQIKYRLQHKKGEYRWIHTFTTVFSRNIKGEAEDMLNISVDITESQKLTLELATLNEAVKFKELQHQHMVSEVEDYAILFMDEDGFIKNWNKGAEKIKGYTASEIIGKNFRLFYRKEDQERKLPETLIQQARETGKASHEGWRLRKDGTSFWGNVVITAVHDDNGSLIGFTKVTRDLTEKKLAEDTLQKYAKRIEKHNEELLHINKDLDAFTYMASHDLQEPLRKIKTFCNLITEKASHVLPEDALNYFNRITASATRMQTLIDSLLTYSRTTTKEVVVSPADLNTILEDVKKELADVIKDNNVIITQTKLPTLTVQPLQIHQLFVNLMENAIKYRRENVVSQINITGSLFTDTRGDSKQQFYRIDVADNGIGFEQEHAHTIFKLFQRLHGRHEYSGTGIGLAICKKIVENHKGTISATGKPGKGATFTILLPAD